MITGVVVGWFVCLLRISPLALVSGRSRRAFLQLISFFFPTNVRGRVARILASENSGVIAPLGRETSRVLRKPTA